MSLFALLILLLFPLNSISMDPCQELDELAVGMASEASFNQKTVNPQLLATPSLTLVDDANEDCTVHPDKIKIRKKYTSCCETQIFEFPLGGYSHILHFLNSERARRKSRAICADWFNNALDLLPTRTKPVIPAKSIYSKRDNKKSHTRPNTQCAVKRASKIPLKIKKTITKKQAQQWLYFRNNTRKTTL